MPEVASPIGPPDKPGSLSDAALVMAFESLGDNIEFGLVQRACGVEPLGLFRFNNCAIENLCDVLERGVEHLYDGDDLEIFEQHGVDQYFCRSRQYGDFAYQTLVSPKTIGLADITSRERMKVDYLKRRVLDDLRRGGKIFVRKGCDSLRDLRRLHRALSTYGPHVLLVVVVADSHHLAGTVERLGERLLRGFVAEFKVCHRPEPVDVASWMQLCRNAYLMRKPATIGVDDRRLDSGSSWSFANHCDARAVSSGWGRRRSYGLICREAMTMGVLASRDVATAGLEAREMVVFSAWIRIANDFTGSSVSVSFVGVPTKHIHPIDMRRRDCWQRTWANAQVPRGNSSLTAEIRATGPAGTQIELATWSFERGSAPVPSMASMAEWQDTSKRAFRTLRQIIPSKRQRDKGVPGDKSPDAVHRKAEALIARGAFVMADDILSEAMAAFPSNAALAKLYAVSAHNSGRYAGAVVRWNKALSLNPKDPMCFAGFAANLREHGDQGRAWDVIGSALGQFPAEMVVLSEAARIAEKSGRPAEALQLWEKTIALHGPNPEWLVARDRSRALAGSA